MKRAADYRRLLDARDSARAAKRAHVEACEDCVEMFDFDDYCPEGERLEKIRLGAESECPTTEEVIRALEKEERDEPAGHVTCDPKKPPPNGGGDSWRLFFCEAMLANVRPEDDVGLSPYVLERNLAGVCLKVKAKDKGVLVNHCPFCGTNLECWLTPHLKKKS